MSELHSFIPEYNMFLKYPIAEPAKNEQTPLYSMTLQILPQKRFTFKGVNCRWDKYGAQSQQEVLEHIYAEFISKFNLESQDCQYELSPNLGTMHIHAYFADPQENYNIDAVECHFRKYKMPNSKFQHLLIERTQWSSANWLKYIHKGNTQI